LQSFLKFELDLWRPPVNSFYTKVKKIAFQVFQFIHTPTRNSTKSTCS